MCACASRLAVEGVYCEVAGSGPPVFLTHDGLLHNESFDAQFHEYSRCYRVARWDRRGYGRSRRPTAPYSNVEDPAAVVRSVSDSPAILIVCSFGGLVSVQCALDHPQLVAALVLVGPVVTGLRLSEHFQTRGGRRVLAPGSPAGGADHVLERCRSMVYRARQYRGAGAASHVADANPQNLRPPMDLERRRERPALPLLGGVAVPTLIVAGEHDHPDAHAHCGAIEAGIPGATRVVLADSGHLPHLEVPAVFNRVVLEFLAEAARHDRH